MPSVERIKKHFNSPTFKKRIKEDKRLTTLQDRTEREADIEGIATDDSDDESDESTFLADMDIDAEMTSNWEQVQELPTSQTSQHLSTWLQISSDELEMQNAAAQVNFLWMYTFKLNIRLNDHITCV